jgi:hypothetical protein
MNYGIADYIVVGVVCGSVIWFIATGLLAECRGRRGRRW